MESKTTTITSVGKEVQIREWQKQIQAQQSFDSVTASSTKQKQRFAVWIKI